MKNQVAALLIAVGSLASVSHASELDKIAFIQQHFTQESRHSQWWQNGWLTVVGVNAAGNAAAAKDADTRAERIDTGTALSVSALGIFSSLRNPMQLHSYQQTLYSMPQSPGLELQQKLAVAEQMLKTAADREAYEQSNRNRLTSAAINAVAGLIISTEGSGDREGLVSLLTGIAFSELKIRTAPRQSITAWRNYQNGQFTPARSVQRPSLTLSFDGIVLSANWRF